MSLRFVLVAPWKVDAKGPFAAGVRFYEERLSRGAVVQLIHPAQTLVGEREATQFLLKECRRLQAENHALFFLDESGRTLDSSSFSGRIDTALVRGHRGVAFCLGGAYGLSEELATLGPRELISLSPLTLPHELALVVLMEQIYRAQCIRVGHPYHHGEKSGLSRAAAFAPRK